MALQNDDLLIVQRPASKQHYKIKVSDMSTLPDGNTAGDYLKWSGSEWAPSQTIDCGVYAS